MFITQRSRGHRRGPKPAWLLSLFIAMALFGLPFASPAHAAAPTQNSNPKLASPVNCSGCWHPALNTSWQWQLTTPVDQTVNVAMYDIDMFDNSASVVSSLHAAGRKVICYIDVGGWEQGRPDYNQIPQTSPVLGNPVDGFPQERWIDIRQLSVIGPIMQARMDQCKSKGFDGAELDLIDGYTNTTGFPLTAQDQLNYDTWLANQAHSRGLSVAQKGNPEQVATLISYFDWELDEQCFEFSECDSFVPYIQAGKAVMEVEYNLATSKFCPQANKMNFNSMKKNVSLDAPRTACR